jgi:prophage antirepressor-like protein|nr:MAG TPA: antirepressor [Caudoviricetes sp.]
MNNSIKIFENPEFGQVRVIVNNSNEPLFCLSDVCRILEL